MCKVSVVMPVRNGGRYFAAALASVCRQTLKDIEVLVVDADSEDGTLDLVRQMAASDHRIRLIRSRKRSMGHQYNLGIHAAKGEYIAFCESDDEYVPEFLNRLYDIARMHDFPDAVKSDFTMFVGDDDERLKLHYHVLDSKHCSLYGQVIQLKNLPDLIFRDVNMWNGIYRRGFLEHEQVILNETAGAAFQDTDFIEQVLLNAKRIIYTEGESYLYRRDNPDASTFKDTSIFWGQELAYMLAYFEEHPSIDEYYRFLIVERLFGGYCSSVIQSMLYHPTTAPVSHEQSSIILESLKAFCQQLSPAMHFRLRRNYQLWLFLEDQRAYWQNRQKRAAYEQHLVETFRSLMKCAPEVCIFGTGELGQSVYMNLRLNQYMGKIRFCDSSSEKINRKLFGIRTQSVEEAVRERDCFFLLPSPMYAQEMMESLLQQGVPMSRIVAYPSIAPHSAFEFCWMGK